MWGPIPDRQSDMFASFAAFAAFVRLWHLEAHGMQDHGIPVASTFELLQGHGFGVSTAAHTTVERAHATEH